MAQIGRVTIRLPATIRQGEVIRVRVFLSHPMEIVQRDKEGAIIVKNYNFVHTMSVFYDRKPVMRAELTQAISQNPSFTFPLKVDRPGKLTVAFADTGGKTYEASVDVKFT
ncbi:MAG TPA: thiosulfate oxidation carrier complex protein SoxZ [Candidatus Eisenbacteria bacterium]|nr:thiosulfate oxidation carrier complex protein SoxZ [Candidatus Eisenbacteria bacterium]